MGLYQRGCGTELSSPVIFVRGRKGDPRVTKLPIELMVAEYPWEMVTLDFLSGFTPSVPGKWEGCIVVCDRFSKMMHVRECSVYPTAKDAALLFLQLVFRAHGLPQVYSFG